MPRSDVFRTVSDLRLRLAAAAVAAAIAFVPAAVCASDVHRVGDMELHACPDLAPALGAYCGDFARPFDPADAHSVAIGIHFEFYPHTAAGTSSGTLVATEGGPGFAATLSRDDYLDLFGPLRATRDVLIMDNRGTGRSGAIDCHELQTGATWTVDRVGACGAMLGERAPFYGTAYATDDLAAIIEHLRLGKIDLYGDSYGTYFAQAFATRHPTSLHSIVLDGAYPLTGPDYAWYPQLAPAMRDKFNLACARSASCAALPGTSLDHIERALGALRAAPAQGRAADADGQERTFRVDATQLAIVLFGGAPAFTTARETDAAARAYVAGDRAPLLRLMAETASAVDSRDAAADPTHWSAGLAAAVMCQDPPQIFDMRLPPAARALDRDRALADRRRTHPDTYAPFSIDEYRGMPLDYSLLDQCASWPVAPPAHPSGQVGKDAHFPNVPALVISGEFDALTTVADGAAVAAAFPRGVQVRIVNSFHVNALPRARSACGAKIARHFLATQVPGDVSCAARVAALRLVPTFVIRSEELEPVHALPGNAATDRQRRTAQAAVMAVGDVLARLDANSSGHGMGLRGGTFRQQHAAAGVAVALDRVRWAEDIAVSGVVLKSSGRHGRVDARLRLAVADGTEGRLDLSWREGSADATVRIRGHFGANAVVARSRAP